MKKIFNRKGQEEMVGFILIIILVVVIGLFFSFILFKNKPKTISSKEVESFLNSISIYTTDCGFSIDEYYNVKELIEACYFNRECDDGRNSCSVLNETIYNLIKSSFNIGKDSKYVGFNLRIYVGNDSIMNIKEGIQRGDVVGAEIFFPSLTDNIYLRLRLYTKII